MGAYIRSILAKLADWLGLKVQGETPVSYESDVYDKQLGLSIVDNISSNITPMVVMDYKWEVRGDSERAVYLDGMAERFVNKTLAKSVQTCLNTGEALIVPAYSHGKIVNQLIDSFSYNIIEAVGDELIEIQFVLDLHETKEHKYALLEDIRYDASIQSCIYTLYIAVDGVISQEFSRVPKWAAYSEQPWWIVPNVDRLLVGRMKSPFIDPACLNSVKGVPLCLGAGQAINELRKLYGQVSFEFDASEKMIMADKTLFEKDPSTGQIRLPRGKGRIYQPVTSGSLEGSGMMKEYSPSIRVGEYESGIDIQNRLVEQSIGANGGLLSKSSINYENVDNVRKGQLRTNALIANIRTAADEMMTDLIYAWDKLLNYYIREIGVQYGGWEDVHAWSDEFITTFDSKMNQLLNGIQIGAISKAEYRQWVMGGSIEDAERDVIEIAESERVGEDSEGEQVVE